MALMVQVHFAHVIVRRQRIDSGLWLTRCAAPANNGD
jgi:hypothetical protein